LTTCAWTEEIIEEEGTKKVRRREIAVRTDRPIPLRKMIQAAAIIRKYQVPKKVQQGEVLKRNLVKTQANVIVTRE
jgi:CxxC motif-containing protein